jgi:hypothetical protein
MNRLITVNHVSLPSSRLYTLISIFPDATPQQVLGSKPVLWELDKTGRSLRQSLIIQFNSIHWVFINEQA